MILSELTSQSAQEKNHGDFLSIGRRVVNPQQDDLAGGAWSERWLELIQPVFALYSSGNTSFFPQTIRAENSFARGSLMAWRAPASGGEKGQKIELSPQISALSKRRHLIIPIS